MVREHWTKIPSPFRITKYFAVALVLLGCASRIYSLTLENPQLTGDASEYFAAAADLAYFISEGTPADRVVDRTPGLPALMAVLFLVSEESMALQRIATALLSCAVLIGTSRPPGDWWLGSSNRRSRHRALRGADRQCTSWTHGRALQPAHPPGALHRARPSRAEPLHGCALAPRDGAGRARGDEDGRVSTRTRPGCRHVVAQQPHGQRAFEAPGSDAGAPYAGVYRPHV